MDTRPPIQLALPHLGPRKIEVIHLKGRESLSKPFRFDVRFAAPTAEMSGEPLVGQRARLALHSEAATRYVTGLIASATEEGESRGDRFTSIRIVPSLWLLKRRRTSRVFQDLSVPEVVARVLDEAGVAHRWRSSRDYAKRDYCVQYQESDAHFIRRLLAEEGIFYWFEPAVPKDAAAPVAGSEQDTVIFADQAVHYPAIEGNAVLPFRSSGAMVGGEHVSSLHDVSGLRESRVHRRGYDYERPDFTPEASKDADAPALTAGRLHTYDHDRLIEDRLAPSHVATLRLEELRADVQAANGESSCRRLAPGHTFTLSDHTHRELNQDYVVVELHHEGALPLARQGVAQPEDRPPYVNRFRVVPASTPLRPKLRKRRIHQITETATVVGPATEEIHTDRLGRVKVQFHWDLHGGNNEHSSCWLRVMQGWAGGGWGSQLIPRIGMEVVITFVGGDTDRPMVLGAVYNGHNLPPFALPENKTQSGLRTRSSPGGGGENILRFEDHVDQEQIYLQAERNFDELVGRDHTRTVRGREVVSVDEDRLTQIFGNNVRVVEGSETLLVEGSLVTRVAGGHVLSIGGGGEARVPEEQAAKIRELLDGPAAAAMSQDVVVPKDELVAENARLARMIWNTERLSGDDYKAAEILLRQVEGASGTVASVVSQTGDISNKLGTLREQVLAQIPVDQALEEALGEQAAAVTKQASEIGEQIAKHIEDNVDTVPALEQVQRLAVEQLEAQAERLGKAKEVVDGAKEVLDGLAALRGGEGEGGGGATTGFKDAEVSFKDYHDAKGGKTDDYKNPKGSKMDISGGGEIISPDGFKIIVGGSSIVMTPGSIDIRSTGDVKVNGANVKLNC